MAHFAPGKTACEFLRAHFCSNAGKAILAVVTGILALLAAPSAALDLDARLDDTVRNRGLQAIADGWFYVGTDVDGGTLTIRYRVPADIRPDDGMVRMICQAPDMRDLIEAGATVRIDLINPKDGAVATLEANADRCYELARAIDAEFGGGWAFAPERVHRALDGQPLEEALARIAGSIANWSLNDRLTLVWANSEGTTINLHVAVNQDSVDVDANEMLKNICRDRGMATLIAAGTTFKAYFEVLEDNPDKLPNVLTIIAATDCDRLSADADAKAPIVELTRNYDEFIRNTFRKLVWQQIGKDADAFRFARLRFSPEKRRAYVYEFSGNAHTLSKIDQRAMGAAFCAHKDAPGLFKAGGLIWLVWQDLAGEELANVRIDAGYCDKIPAARRRNPETRQPRGERDDMIERFVVASANAPDALPGLRTTMLDPELPTITSIHRITKPGNMQVLREKQIRSVCGDPAVRRQIDRGVVAEYVLQRSDGSEHGVITVDSEICEAR